MPSALADPVQVLEDREERLLARFAQESLAAPRGGQFEVAEIGAKRGAAVAPQTAPRKSRLLRLDSRGCATRCKNRGSPYLLPLRIDHGGKRLGRARYARARSAPPIKAIRAFHNEESSVRVDRELLLQRFSDELFERPLISPCETERYHICGLRTR